MQLGTDQNTNVSDFCSACVDNVILCTYVLQHGEVVRFELDSKKLSELLAQVTAVEKAIEQYSRT